MTRSEAKPGRARGRRSTLWEFSIPVLVRDLPQRREDFARVLEFPFCETDHLFFYADTSCLRRRVLHPDIRKVVDV